MIIIIHLINGKTVQLKENFTQQEVEQLFKQFENAKWVHLNKNGKNHIIPCDKIVYIETKVAV